uniref:Uncharacterized protein n=1 Tax=Rhizophagus irregularis (strain DAOM 181602 / DAOM 197198 / MUCL 43194) TaxID=747089 RepID=U9TF30_RHIID
MLYRDLTGDASLANDQISKEMEEILRLMMSLEDPSIIIDLRINNGFQGSNLIYFGMNLMDILMRKVYICYKDTVFQPSDFDMLIAVRTAPHHSWCNPAERIMSVINYELQGVAIGRDELEDEFETLKTLEDILQELLRERTEHLIWKNETFETEDLACLR